MREIRLPEIPSLTDTYTVGGSVTIDTYENVWGWDKGTEPSSYDIPDIYGAFAVMLAVTLRLMRTVLIWKIITGAGKSLYKVVYD